MVWLPLLPSAKAAPGACPSPFSFPVRDAVLSLHLFSLAPVLQAGTPAVEQDLRPGEAALEILVVLVTLAQVFQALSLLLEKKNDLFQIQCFSMYFFLCCFLLNTNVHLRKGYPVLSFAHPMSLLSADPRHKKGKIDVQLILPLLFHIRFLCLTSADRDEAFWPLFRTSSCLSTCK